MSRIYDTSKEKKKKKVEKKCHEKHDNKLS